ATAHNQLRRVLFFPGILVYNLRASLNNWHLLHCAIERLRNGAYTTGQTNFFWFTSPGDAGELRFSASNQNR
ncbi:hypothetical protein, partial [Escherichia coli]|uniref:hypothetical protein n=1 Tax=Escherichia coli TaxID=562 RepID=UPI001BCC3CB2